MDYSIFIVRKEIICYTLERERMLYIRWLIICFSGMEGKINEEKWKILVLKTYFWSKFKKKKKKKKKKNYLLLVRFVSLIH